MENKTGLAASLAIVALLPVVSTAAPSVPERLAEVRAMVAQADQGDVSSPNVPKLDQTFANAPQP